MVRIINIDTKTRTIRVSNGKDDLEWFTTDTGSHVPLKKGQSKAEAIKEHFGDKKITKKGSAKQPSTPGTAAYHYERADALAKMIETREKELKSDKLLPAAKQAIRDGIAELQLEISKHWDKAGKLEKASKQPAKQDKQKLSRDNVKDKSGGANETLDQMLTTGGLTKYERYRMEKMMEHHDIKPDDIIAVLESGEYTPEQVLETVDNYDNEEAILHMLDVAKAKQQPAKQEPYSDPFHKEAEQKRNSAKDAWLKAKPQVDTKKLRAGDPETFEKYMDWRWQATTLSDGYDEMMKDFGGRDEFNKAAQAYEKLKK